MNTGELDPLLKKALKLLLMQLAAKYDNPSARLEAVLVEVIQELYFEAKEDLEAKKRKLRLVQPS